MGRSRRHPKRLAPQGTNIPTPAGPVPSPVGVVCVGAVCVVEVAHDLQHGRATVFRLPLQLPGQPGDRLGVRPKPPDGLVSLLIDPQARLPVHDRLSMAHRYRRLSPAVLSMFDHWSVPLVFHYDSGMFMITVTYTVPLDEIDRWRPAHADWLKQLIAQRRLLVAGRQVPLVGGVYLAAEMPTEELNRLLSTDPYVLNDVATHSVVEFTPALVAAGLEDLMGQ